MNNIQFGQSQPNPYIPQKPFQTLGDQGAVGYSSANDQNPAVTAPSSAFAAAVNNALGQYSNASASSALNNAASSLSNNNSQFTNLVSYINQYPLTDNIDSATTTYTANQGTTPATTTGNTTGSTTGTGTSTTGNGSFNTVTNTNNPAQTTANTQPSTTTTGSTTSTGTGTGGSGLGSFGSSGTSTITPGGTTSTTTTGSTGTISIPGVGDVPNSINGVPISHDSSLTTDTTGAPVDPLSLQGLQTSIAKMKSGVNLGQIGALEQLYYNGMYGYAKGTGAVESNPNSGGSLAALAAKIQNLLSQQNSN